MTTICNTCILANGCAFNKDTSAITTKCRDYIDISLSIEELTWRMRKYEDNPIALTKDDIQ